MPFLSESERMRYAEEDQSRAEGSGRPDGAGASAGLSLADSGRAGGSQAARPGPGNGQAVGGQRRDRCWGAAGGHLGGAGGDQDVEGEGSPARGRQRHSALGYGFLRGGTRPPQPLIMAFIDDMRSEGHAVESTCRVLREQGCPVAARTYRAWKQGRAPAARTVTDAVVMDAIIATAGTPEGLYGRRKMTHYLRLICAATATRWHSAPSTGSWLIWVGAGSAAAKESGPRSRPRMATEPRTC